MPTLDLTPAPAQEPVSHLRQVRNLRGDRPKSRTADKVAQLIALAILLAGPAIICLHTAFVNDSDIWWHLRTGEWIVQHQDVPRAEPFSILAGSPWVAYSWLFEVIVYKLFHAMGLTGLVTYSVSMVLLNTIALYRIVSRYQPDFSIAVLLTFATMYSMGHMFTPRPWMFTILLFLLEVDILMQARHTGRKAGLCWLPLIFAVWANTHIQFVYGLFVLGLVFAETIASRWTKNAERGVGPLWMGLALAASVLGSLLNPYGWRLYAVAHDLAIQSGALNKITELQSIPFRSAPDFMVLFLALSGAGALGWRRKLLSFEGVLFAFAVWLSFRSQRDVWITAIVTAILLANSIRTNRKSAEVTSAAGYTGACVLAICFLFAGFKLLRVNNEALQVQIDETFPVNAVQKLATYRLSGPVYSDFNWGGYLIWHLRNPVVMDGRQNVYGDKRMDRSVETWAGGPDWSNDPELASAMAVVGPVKSPLIQLLRTDHRFRKVYEDNTAAVFLPNR